MKKRVFIIIAIVCLLVLTACTAKKDCSTECIDKGYNQGICRSSILQGIEKSVCGHGETAIGHTEGCPAEDIQELYHSCCCS
ncbi:MAG: hypothetical protein ABIE94_05380 [archaeon]